MKTVLVDFSKKVLGEIELDDNIFGIKDIRQDIIKSVIDWQLLKTMSGTHQTKTISQVSGTTKKPFRQKGTGSARQGSLRSVQMRGGGISHGPVFRSHAINLPKKVRKLGLIHALSSKFTNNKLYVIDNLSLSSFKTSYVKKLLNEFHGISYLIVCGEVIDSNLMLAVRNIPRVTILLQIGINVYDILSHDYILLSKDSLQCLENRLK